MKKWFKECPFCANEIKEKAIKCQYCWEFLPKEEKESPKEKVKKETKECSFCMNEIDVDATICPFCDEHLYLGSTIKTTKMIQNKGENKFSVIKAWNILWRWCIWMFILFWISFLGWLFGADFVDTDEFTGIITLIWLIWAVIIIGRCRTLYKYILNFNKNNLHFDSLWWPTRWWICPVANLIVPYHAVLDIYESILKRDEPTIIKWRWWCHLGSSIIMICISMFNMWYFWGFLWICLVLAELILIMKIIKNIEKSLNS